MKASRIGAAAVVIMAMASAMTAWAVPGLINYQGKLTDSGGAPITGASVPMQFTLWDGETAGTVLWNEAKAVAVEGGIYSVVLGDSVPIPPGVFTGVTVYLELNVNGETMAPRQRLTSVPYAMNAELLGGMEPTAFAAANHVHDFSELTGAATDAQVPDDITIAFAQDSDLLDGIDSTGFAVASHVHDFSELTGTATDAQVPDDITVNFAQDSDNLDGLDSTAFAAASHVHDFSELTGAATDAQVPDDITVNFAQDSNNLDGLDSTAFAAVSHGHDFSELTGTATDAQVPDDITINFAQNSDQLDGLDAAAFASASHTHLFSQLVGSVMDDQVPDDITINFAQDSNLLDGLDSTSFASVDHLHSFADITGEATDAQIPDDITINFAQNSDLLDGLDAMSFASVDHLHDFIDITGQATGSQIADNAITSAHILDGTITDADVSFNYAGSSSQGGPALDVSCADCVSASEIADGSGSGLDADYLDGQHGAYYLSASNLNAGTLSTSRFSAYSDLSAEGYLDNSSSSDLLTRSQLDSRYVNQWENWASNMIVTGTLEVSGGALGIGTPANTNYGIINSASGPPSYGTFLYGSGYGLYGMWASDPTFNFGYIGAANEGIYAQAGRASLSGTKFGGNFQANSSTYAYGVQGAGYGSGSYETVGVNGYAQNSSTATVYGGKFEASDSGTGVHYGVYATASIYPVYGAFSLDPGGSYAYIGSQTYGIYGRAGTSSSTPTMYGGYLRAYSANSSYGLQARGYGYGTSTTYGLYGYATNSGGGSAYGLYVPTGTKNWVNPDPEDPDKSIAYVTVESGENVTYLAARGRLTNGRAEIVLPDHFRKVTSPDHPVIVTATPRENCNGLMVTYSDNERIVVQELMNGTSNAEFDYMAKGIRLGYEDYEPIIDNVDYVPFQGNQADEDQSEFTTQEWYDVQLPGVKRILKQNGSLDKDGKVNEKMFKDKKWKLVKEKKPKKIPATSKADHIMP